MSGIAYNNTELVTTLTDRGLIPTDQTTFDTASFLRSCTQEMFNEILSELMRTRNQYLTWIEDQQLVVGRDHYRIPHRAVGGKLEDVLIVNSDGSYRKLTLIQPQDVTELLVTTVNASGTPIMFYLENYDIVLYPSPNDATPSLRVKYAIRPGKLVVTTDSFLISAITAATPTATQTRINSASPTTLSWTTSTLVDLIAGKPGFQYLGINKTMQAVTAAGGAGTIDFLTADLPTGSKALAVGDWINLQEEAAVPQVPPEYHAVLALFGLAAHLQALGDLQGAKFARDYADGELKRAMQLITPRVNGKVKRVKNRDWFGGRRWR